MVERGLFRDSGLSWWPAIVHSVENLAYLHHDGILTAFSAEPYWAGHFVVSAL